MREQHFIACDLGAGSGRVVLATLREGRLTLDDVHRFKSAAVKRGGTLRWDIAQIFEELKTGLRKIAASGKRAASVSVDSWGVDYVLFRGEGQPLDQPYHYRDTRTDAPYAAAMKDPGQEPIFRETGIQFMPINTLYQLLAEQEQNRSALESADAFLNIADYLNFRLCGVAKAEESLASTTQLYNPNTRGWSEELVARFDFPRRIFPEIVPPGTPLGPLLPAFAVEVGSLEVVATCSHDTGAAVAAVPAVGEDWAFLSSGTWSLLGIELPAPLINAEVRARNFTNEAGFGGTTRFLKNIVGLWLLQESQRAWKEQGLHLDYPELSRQAAGCEPFRSLIDPRDPRFGRPDAMPEKIAAFCRETDQPVPETPGRFTRCIYESLAFLYADTLAEAERLTSRRVARLHVMGGGSNSALLNQLTADATGRAVLAGPVEATAAGNALIQAIALGRLASIADARRVVRDSFPILQFQPRRSAAWQAGAERFARFTSNIESTLQ